MGGELLGCEGMGETSSWSRCGWGMLSRSLIFPGSGSFDAIDEDCFLIHSKRAASGS